MFIKLKMHNFLLEVAASFLFFKKKKKEIRYTITIFSKFIYLKLSKASRYILHMHKSSKSSVIGSVCKTPERL